MATKTLLTFIWLLTSLPPFFTMTLDTNATADNLSPTSLASGAGGLEMRKLRHIEAELEVLRRTVTEIKAGGQCGAQSPHPNVLKEVTSEIQALRSQFQALQMQRELSVLRSDILLAQSAMLADTGSRRSAMLEDDASKSVSVGRTAESENGVAQNIPFTLNTGSLYERWGNEMCPNDTELVYSGIIAGSEHQHPGAAANALCLPLTPVLENNPGVGTVTVIYGAELQVAPLPKHDLDPRCAVCRAPRATVAMVPAANACHRGWTLEYAGYIMAGHHTHPAATDFSLCRQGATRTHWFQQ
ncbi:hypothetical protein C0Q70_15618 [Pomacea canaliculata]|uniref:Uncharacterized protein n=1 Tax=Pomacea canaliculata TaxID=400727 RepID=A0A2T7NVC2_POMCA|nr:uncharacterized protein LOC112572831 [Pomacea canaliculata]PVD25120.1 hypothetical protein C0Q70_15618 [Pomacea canaliculata]